MASKITHLAISAVLGVAAAFATAGASAAQESMTEVAPQTETVVHEGVWTKKNFDSAGTWRIVERDGAYFVSLDADFRTRRAPDLKLFLSPGDAAGLTNETAVNGSLFIAALSSNRGAQEYRLPDDVDLSDFRSIIIHCEAFTKLWSAADLA